MSHWGGGKFLEKHVGLEVWSSLENTICHDLLKKVYNLVDKTMILKPGPCGKFTE